MEGPPVYIELSSKLKLKNNTGVQRKGGREVDRWVNGEMDGRMDEQIDE